MSNVRPIHYKIHLEPDLDKFIFNGTTEIIIETDSPVDSIVLNINELAIWDCKVKKENELQDCSFSVNPKEQELTVNLPEKMNKIELLINYEGKINDKLVGFYRSRYHVGDELKYMAVTQFEETDARRAFPCMDHPSKKATFDIEFVIDKNLKAIANTMINKEKDLGNGKKLVKFETTPKMCTYLLFFGVGDFEFIEDKSETIRYRVATPPGKTQYANFALDFSRKCVEYGEEYTGVEFPINKMDQIAVADFAFGAMENYAAITYRENLLLVYPGITSSAGLERIAEVIAHEIAHQWFGNLVSPADWKYIWLNESFATLFGYAIANHYHPEWGIWNSFYLSNDGAFERDSLIETFPIELPGKDEQTKITAATAPIIYNKGGAILQMIRGYLGEENFKKGINYFLNKYKFDVATSEQYWESFEEAIGEPIIEMMKSWINQPGYPLITVERQSNELIFNQERFTYLKNNSTQTWMIPLTIKFFDIEGNFSVKKALFKDKTMNLAIPDNCLTFKVNIDQTGFYRVKYEKSELEKLGQLIRDKKLSFEDRYGLHNDLFALVKRGDFNIGDYLSFLDNYEEEEEYLPLVTIHRNLMSAYYVIDSKREEISRIGRKIFGKVLSRIGYEPKDDEPHSMANLRSSLLLSYFIFGGQEAKDFAVEQFALLQKGEKVHPDILSSVLSMGAMLDGKSYDWFVEQLESPKTPETKKISILLALGRFNNKELVFKALKYTLDQVPARNKFYPIATATQNLVVVEDLWDWYQQNLSELEKMHPMHYEQVVSSIIGLPGLSKEKEVRQFFTDYMKKNKQVIDTIKMSLERLTVNSRLRNA